MPRRRWSWKDVDLPREIADALAGRFLTRLYEASLESDPRNVAVLVELGDLYSRQGLVEASLEVDRRLVAAHPRNGQFQFNLACSHSVLGHLDAAFEALDRALQLGYDGVEQILSDPDLANLREDRRFAPFAHRLQERPAT